MKQNGKRKEIIEFFISPRYYTRRTKLFAIESMIVNIAMGAGKTIMALVQNAFYFGCNGLYNIAIGMIKMFALKKHKACAGTEEALKKQQENAAALKLSVMVTAASIFYLAIGIVSLFYSHTLSYDISTVCFIAASAFGKLTLNAFAAFTNRQSDDTIVKYINATNVADALVGIGLTQRAILIMMQQADAYFFSAVGEILFSFLALATGVGMLLVALKKRKSSQ